MGVTAEGMIGRAIMASTAEERRLAEDVVSLLVSGSRMLTDWRSVVVIEHADGGILASCRVGEWDGSESAVRDLLRSQGVEGYRVIDGRDFTAAGKLRKAKVKA